VYKQRTNFELEEGLSVLCRARLNVYLPRGEYQLVIESVKYGIILEIAGTEL
jgi:exodeoxyribonuclease VII large subunit